MVADDQPSNGELLKEFLSAQGTKVITVEDGAGALVEQLELSALIIWLVSAASDSNDPIRCAEISADAFLGHPMGCVGARATSSSRTSTPSPSSCAELPHPFLSRCAVNRTGQRQGFHFIKGDRA
jgi:hypothetical protein